MAAIGFSDLKELTLPALWDEDYLKKLQLEDGMTMLEVAQEAQAAMNMLNAEMVSVAGYSGLFAIDNEAELEYPIGVDNSFEESTEYGTPDPIRGGTTGHMLPIKSHDIAVGWTLKALKRLRRGKIQSNIKSMINAGRKLYQQQLLTRMFTSTANTVGTTASDVPFADGGSADATYIPEPSPGGETFLYTHNHFLGYSTSGVTASTLDQSAVNVAIEHLQEHGIDGPYDLVGSRDDAAEWSNTENVTGWKPPLWGGIAYQQSAVERAQFGDVDHYQGAIETDYGIVRVWLTPRLPSDNFAVFKTYGAEDGMNPLRMRYRPSTGFGFKVLPGIWANSPLQLLVVEIEFGVGVGENRCAAVCVDVGASTWAAPTIS